MIYILLALYWCLYQMLSIQMVWQSMLWYHNISLVFWFSISHMSWCLRYTCTQVRFMNKASLIHILSILMYYVVFHTMSDMIILRYLRYLICILCVWHLGWYLISEVGIRLLIPVLHGRQLRWCLVARLRASFLNIMIVVNRASLIHVNSISSEFPLMFIINSCS